MIVVGLAASAALAQDEGFRFFFDTVGVNEPAARPAATALGFTNPIAPDAGGAGAGQRLYIYLGYGTNNQNFSSVNLRVTVSGVGGIIRTGQLWNHVAGLARWQTYPGTATMTPNQTTWDFGSLVKVGGGGYGARNNDGTGANGPDTPGSTGPTQTADSHFRADDGSSFGTTLLGYIDVDNTNFGLSSVSVKLGSGGSGSAGVTVGNGDFVYFGFGDAGTTNKANRTSANADATVRTPEPASMALLGLGALALRRRR
jgi:MYXO-CTERM domain-containing protein